VQAVVQSLKAQFGPYQGVTPQPDGAYLVRFQRGMVRARIHLDGQGRLDGLHFTSPQFIYVSRSALSYAHGPSRDQGVNECLLQITLTEDAAAT
jgi:hypothetical protein